jgi:hypothetical protein
MRPQRDDVAWVARFIQTTLRWSPRALTRDELSARVLEQQHLAGVGVPWSPATADRRTREAIERLLDGDNPPISAGHGYKLAALATQQERERAAELAERQATRLFAKARKIRAVTLPGDPAMGELFPGFRP